MEKMQLGSPAGSPAQATPYLPNFLMGENTPANHHHRSFCKFLIFFFLKINALMNNFS